ncbi:MAG: hypothetical protein ACSW8H_05135, partial [bacterium]
MSERLAAKTPDRGDAGKYWFLSGNEQNAFALIRLRNAAIGKWKESADVCGGPDDFRENKGAVKSVPNNKKTGASRQELADPSVHPGRFFCAFSYRDLNCVVYE